MSEMFRLALDRIDWKADDNPRDGSVDETRFAELQESDPTLWPPIVVALEGNDRYRGIDGYARWTAAKTLGVAELPAVVEILPGDIRSRAFELNQHGWPLRTRERRAQAVYLHQRYPEFSDREIARRCGLSPTTVASATVQNGQQEVQDNADSRRGLAKAALRFGQSFTKFRKLVGDSFIINLNPPQSVAVVLSEHIGNNREWLAETRAHFLEIADFMRAVAQEIKKQKTPAS